MSIFERFFKDENPPIYRRILLKQPYAWNKWRFRNSRIKIDLQGVDLRSTNLQGLNLRDSDLQKANLQGVKLANANLQRANLQRAYLQGANLIFADLQGANLEKTNLQGANLQGVKLQEAKLQGASLRRLDLQGVNLQGADLQGVNFQGANLQGVNLQDTNLQGASLIGASLQRANLQDTNLQGAYLQSANLQGANLQGANLQEANLQGANLQEADLQGVNLQGVNLQEANFTEANLQEANLQEANFTGANLIGACLIKADLRAATLINADLTGACIYHWILTDDTLLDKIKCDFVFLAIVDGKYSERRPIDPGGIYGSGDLLSILKSSLNPFNGDAYRIIRSIEFPPEYKEAGISILTYFSHILSVKYPDIEPKVRIEQKGLKLRMIIETPDGKKEEIERTLEEYGLVVIGEMKPEDFLEDQDEVQALKAKLEIASLELRLTRDRLANSKSTNLKQEERISFLEENLFRFIGDSLHNDKLSYEAIVKVADKDKVTFDLSNAKFGGGFAADGGTQTGGTFIDLSSSTDLADAAQQIQDLLDQLQGQGTSEEEAAQSAATELATQAKADPTALEKLMNWGQSLADTASKTTVSEAVKVAVKTALRMAGVPMP